MTRPGARRIEFNGGRNYIDVPLSRRPPAIGPREWESLAGINDTIIDRLTYDHRRAAHTDRDGAQSPHTTWERRLGVCMDYAALFEHLARDAGHHVMSVSSEQLDHAWNVVRLAGQWWIVDVTWNDGDIFSDGTRMPPEVHRDPDFRRRYLLTTVAAEEAHRMTGLLTSTHAAPDARLIDYQRTRQGRAIVDRIQPLLAAKNELSSAHNAEVDRRNGAVGEYNRVVGAFNSQPTASAKAPYKRRLDALGGDIAAADARLVRLRSESDNLQSRIDELYGEYQRLAADHPLAMTYTLRLD